FLASFSAIWGPLTLAWWTFRRQRSLTWLFVSCYLCWTVGSVLLLDSYAEGRLLVDLLGRSTLGAQPLDWVLALMRFFWSVARSGPLPVLLLPLCLAGSFLAWRQQRLTAYHLALGVCVLTTSCLSAGKEPTSKQLLDPLVLALPVLACLWSDLKVV